MIDWLAGWLREIVLVVLFAAVADMLLPTNGLQRYIKVVISLFILLTILSPVLTLLRSDFNFTEVDAQLNRWQESNLQGSSDEKITRDAERLRRANEQQTARWVEERLAEMMTADLIEQGYTEVQEVQAEIELSPSGHAKIRKVEVYLRAETEEDSIQPQGSEASEPIAQIRPIEPVMIEIRLDDQVQEEKRSGDGDAPYASPLTRQIRQVIAAGWQVAPEQIVFHEAAR
ncbi:hypothetical protein PRECH8_00730 [Insulibacter thermoxylanivorax]|uniref:Stage III sporulation protein AF n=1 Tax=Insulibacter thermoxylanivorax TaxID=2749268 RepID=A0A916QE88_9BACL|nr:stage III sporulation protein AF [Insulibacter thermoxylanivorax]GFR36777.1 hypothetical protein PRECH8_00730 [Insulibacter thermoxylanivorax]